MQSLDQPNNAWQRYDWLKPAEDQKRQTAAGESINATATQDVRDPFTVISNGSLWQEKYGAVYTRRLADSLSLTCETSAITRSDVEQDISHGQKVGVQYQPSPALTLRGDVHDSTSDATLPSNSSITSGAGFWAEDHLPTNSVLTFGVNTDSTRSEASTGLASQTNSYDAQVTQPLGKIPLSAVLKGHYQETSGGGLPASAIPSLEQSLVWKPMQDTTVQMGLRQQQYQEYPGITDQFNQALFADWSQKLVGDVTWHSYAEVLNSKSLIDQAPAAPLASGANGTAQATTPASNVSLSSALPVSIDNQTLTFSTGPSFHIQKDVSASVEYSNRWDTNPAAGGIGQEQRVSVSVKGTF